MLVQCAGCHGRGGIVDIVDWWGGPIEPCGYCQGTGLTTRIMNCCIMRWQKNPSWEPKESTIQEHERQMAASISDEKRRERKEP